MDSARADQQERILQAISAKRWSQVDELWLELHAGELPPVEFHQPIIDKLIRKQQPQHFVALYETVLDAYIDQGKGGEALELIEYIASHNDELEFLRSRTLKALELHYSNTLEHQFKTFIEKSGLEQVTKRLRDSLQNFNGLLGATKGQVFRHAKWGVGVVREMNMQDGKVIIDFVQKAGQVMTLDGIRGFLQPIPKDHLMARIALDPEGLKEKTRTDPAAVLRLALKSSKGRVKVADLKKTLTTNFLTENEYKRFWEGAKTAIKIDPWIDQIGAGAHAELILRNSPRSFFDQILQSFIKAKDAAARREVLRDVRRHGAEAETTQQDKELLYQLFLKVIADGTLKNEQEHFNHGMLFLEFEDLFEGKQNPVDVDALLKSDRAVELISGIDVPDSRRIALEKAMVLCPDTWAEIFAEVTITLDTRTAAWMDKELQTRGHDHERLVALERIFAHPDKNADLFTWAARNVLAGQWEKLGESLPATMICEELLSVLSQIEEKFESKNEKEVTLAKNQAAKIRAVLNEGNGKLFKKAIQKSTIEEARRLMQMVRLHNALSHPMKRQLEDILVDQHIDLRVTSRMDEEEERKKPAYHYTTQQSLDEKRSELSRLVSHEIPAMAKVIEAARELGDLKENAEYHAAKDRQKLLMQQAAELEDLIARARVVDEREGDPTTTRFGTRIGLRETANGNTSEVTLLGMWEGSPEKGIISYLTPFGSQLLGRKVGEKFPVNMQDGSIVEYECVSISAAILPGGQSS